MNDIDNMTFEDIKDLRRLMGCNQEYFGRLFEVSQKAVSKWETGRGKPSKLAMRELKKMYKKFI